MGFYKQVNPFVAGGACCCVINDELSRLPPFIAHVCEK